MPDTNLPVQNKWISKMHEVIGKPDKDLILVGHSIGSVSILRYLESLDEDLMIGGAVLVAGFTDDLGFEEISNFFETPFDFDAIRSKTPYFIAIHSDDDPYVPLKHASILKEKLGAQVIIKENMKHFSGPVDDEASCTQLQDALDAILDLVNKIS